MATKRDPYRSKRAKKRVAAAEEVCRAVRLLLASNGRCGFGWDGVIDYLQVWMRHSGKECYADPKRLRKSQTK